MRRTASRSGLPKRDLDRALRLGLRERRHLVLQRLEVARQRDADHVRPRRQELAELHVGRTEPGERGGEPVGGDRAGRPLDQPRETDRTARAGSGSRVGIDHSASTPSRANTNPALAETDDMSKACDHKRQPECSATMPPVMRRNDDALEAGRPHHLGESVGPREAANRFHQIAIGLRVAGDDPAERRDHVEGVEIVEPSSPGTSTAENSRQRKRPPIRSTRCASASAASMRGTLRMPKAMVTAS